ncbi:G-type lectin S-receptor-like serine/threonine-protein kinase RLK1 [Cucurbita pepo subsp. pepo]|uniref:G-type lectin S-receptor-like serine/threonine-protein kinase RLK1 n=1 Tax=Cucurbita pepo subsp. pepo TaxID=3664 RepID=UPI000C9D4A4F|nr:G-type lectin S-receptor-like serine/threonine-protein kinase RLK1 [Cucurbita pepo subsp. pepo]
MVPVSVLLLLLLSFVVVVCSQSNGTRISTGSSLVAGSSSVQTWRSPSDDFAFGFRNVDNNNDDLFLLAIWFYKVPESNIVWFAKENDNNPVFAPRGSKIELTASSGLVLRNGNGGEIWKSEPITASVAFGSMKDTGNFVLVDSINGSIWESFSYPTDTLLPTQKLEVDGVLSSRKSQGNFSLGKFQFRLLRDGNAVLNTINLRSGFPYDAYYISNTYDSASSQNSGRQVIFDEQGFLYVLKRNGEQSNITQPSVGNPVEAYYYRTTMNFDGVLSVSSYPKGIDGDANGSWKDLFRIPENICLSNENPIGRLGSGICGFNSICTLKSNGRPSCNCAQGYSLVDPNDELGNCKPYITQSCDEEEQEGAGNFNQNLYEMVDLPNTNWPMYDYERFSTLNEQVCKSSCLEDCFCVLAVFGGSDCWKKRLPLSNGRQDASITAVSFLKLRKNVSLESFPDADRTVKKQRTLIIVMSALFGSSVFIIFMLLGFKCLGLFVLKKEKLAETCTKNVFSDCNLIQFTFMDIYKATNGFKEEIGRGSCGIVYKGTTEAGAIAVKKLDRMFEADRDKEFRTEVNVIGQTHHKNLVRLLGYCDEGSNRMLVYQFMSNGSLSSFLFNGDPKPSWKLRTRIAFEIARGLLYLHEECDTHIIHCDIKPQNILLDEDYNAKISDFGLAKLLKVDQSRTETGIRGTKGYVAPDWFRSSPINAKVDVYSYGVLLLEIICCRRNVEIELGDGEREEGMILTDWAYDCYEKGRVEALIEGDMEAMDEFHRVERFVRVAIWCIQEDPSKRPTMEKVMLMLAGNVDVSVPPCPYPFSSMV